ncbi:hypothetical protein, conserved [Entamoeba dispar SAW760]|uniref:Leucine rich repeat containing protein BspA family protein n=1 Tax=Entamoeba dispar (strain ATCC PRA-260 / SAW760) TaxID=370354 RepID=B0EQG3_ENTDS|nr:uncharacterized protein EDI_255100 [Entamoeba dispar SAW760]EDR23218.1 hypothetical protein, conserved [Entamoeba dispar SAW760]|eukprot:EDR23218.1 hypothetical protein, conserved [Entamoeba dispar SAW760]
MRLGHNEIMITSMYFDDINDFINLEIGIKKFQGNMERFHFNPIPLNEYSRRLFPNIETLHLYSKDDEVFKDGRIFKYIIWYTISYSTYLKEKEEGSVYKNIEYTQSDREEHGNIIPLEVKSLGWKCFEYTDITSITIPKTITKIQWDCFSNCSLTSITIPTTVSEIEDSCFDRCYSLKYINIPSTISVLGVECFQNCLSLTNMSIDNTQFISKERIFMNEPVLVRIEIPECLEMINGKTFEKKDINEFIIPSSITKLGNHCFSGCSSLKSVDIPASVSKIGWNCFCECSSLKKIKIPSSVSKIGDYCFEKCMSLKSVDIPSSVTEIGYKCFYNCLSLKTINIPTAIIKIGDGCFYKCRCEKSLKKNKRIPENCFNKYY